MMSKKAESTRIYFTILPSNAGFTDQLLQFNTYYKLGLSLGYIYLHSEFVNRRHGAEDVYNFLGFNEHFSQNGLTKKKIRYRLMGVNNYLGNDDKVWYRRIKNKVIYWVIYKIYFNEFNFIDLGIGDSMPLEEGVDPIDGLRSLVNGIVTHNSTRRAKRKNVLRLYLTSGKFFFRVLAPLLNQQMPLFPDKLDLRSSYCQEWESEIERLNYIRGKLKLLIHIRLGDTAVIETPWSSFIPLWAWHRINPLKECADKTDPLFRRLMDVDDYAYFLKKLFLSINAHDFSTMIFSDGYKAAFKILFEQLDDLCLSHDKTIALKEAAPAYEQQRFSIFNDIENCVCRIGESNQDLQELIHSTFNADIIVVGCHQRMLPKLISTYYDTSLKSPPLIIALHNGIEPRYKIEIGLDERKARLYIVNINNLDSDDELLPLIKEIEMLLGNPLVASSATSTDEAE